MSYKLFVTKGCFCFWLHCTQTPPPYIISRGLQFSEFKMPQTFSKVKKFIRYKEKVQIIGYKINICM